MSGIIFIEDKLVGSVTSSAVYTSCALIDLITSSINPEVKGSGKPVTTINCE